MIASRYPDYEMLGNSLHLAFNLAFNSQLERVPCDCCRLLTWRHRAGVVVSHFLQQVSSRVALGAELAYQMGPAVPGGQMAMLTAAARWTGDGAIVSGTLGNGGAHICFYQRASEQLSFGVEMETSFRAQESVASLGYAVNIPKADLTFRGEMHDSVHGARHAFGGE